MIGKVTIGKSYKGCIRYCLSNKENQTGMKDRAEVLDFHYCQGSAKELASQFEDVGKLNPKLSNNVMHVTLSFPPGEKLSPEKLKAIAEECAEKMGFDKNQYIVVLHNDTGHQHIHIVANRVGYDGKTVSDSNNYQKMSYFCREMEKKYKLEPVNNPKKFQSKQQRSKPRQDKRKEKLQSDIRNALGHSKSYEEFEKIMKSLGYEMIKGRGIAFRDRQKVYTKSSQVGYPLSKIEKILNFISQSKPVILGKKPDTSKDTLQKILPKNSSDIVRELLKNNPESGPTLLPKKRRKMKRRLLL